LLAIGSARALKSSWLKQRSTNPAMAMAMAKAFGELLTA
jgi:hypothetical protein